MNTQALFNYSWLHGFACSPNTEPGIGPELRITRSPLMISVNKKAYKPCVEKIKGKYYEMFRGNKAARAWKWRRRSERLQNGEAGPSGASVAAD